MFSDETMIVFSAAKAAQRDLSQANNTIHWQNNRIANLIDDIDNGNATIRSLRRELEKLQRSNEKLEKQRKEARAYQELNFQRAAYLHRLLVEFFELAFPNLGHVEIFAETQTKTHNGKTYENVDTFFAHALDYLAKKEDELAQYVTENDLPQITASVWPWKKDIQLILNAIEKLKMKSAKTEYTKTRLLIAEKKRLAELEEQEKQRRELENNKQDLEKKKAAEVSLKSHFLKLQKKDPTSRLNVLKDKVKATQKKQADEKVKARDASMKAHFVQRQKNDPNSALSRFGKKVKKPEKE